MTPEESIEIAAWVEAQDFPCLHRRTDLTDADVAVDIVAHVCALMKVEPKALLGKRRTQHVACARQIAIYAMRELTGLSYPQIAKRFGRDHSTCIHAYDVIERRMAAERQFAHLVEGLLARVGSA